MDKERWLLSGAGSVTSLLARVIILKAEYTKLFMNQQAFYCFPISGSGN
jgi:hypothetical protein